jgi:predicted RNA-binding protein with PUA-like domain
MRRHWLMKSEPDEFSIDDLVAAPNQTTPWFGVRNYQARNFMRDDMRIGDLAFFYHSSCPEPGIAGIVEISQRAYPDETQFDPTSPYYDPKSTRAAPRWLHVDVKLVRKTKLVTLPMLRETPGLETMVTLRRGNRLSITPVSPAEWKIGEKLAKNVSE